ncbi:MAG: molybdopterin-dependent oxidoreductase, partial [Spirochaetales bacterium]|nr:molybdopterin-dependent oxidoreductase [Spirochaetales bacterium]
MSEAIDKLKGKIPCESTGITIKKSICTICDPMSQCGMNLYIKEDKIIKVEGSKEHPRNEGTLCSKGSATRQYVYNADRLKTPLKRVGPKGSDEFVPISWDEALDTIAHKLNDYKNRFGPESVAFFCGYTKWLRPFLHRLAYSFGSPNYLTESSTCHQATVMAQKLNFGTTTGPDVKNTNCLMVWSSNPFHSNTTLARKILGAKDRGMKIITIDPRPTLMAAQADIHLQLKPGTDGALALTMANVIINENLADRDFIANYTFGYEEYAQYVQEFTPEKGASITGVPADKIKQAARLYAKTKPAAIMSSAAPVVHHTNGVQNYRAVFSLIALTGNFDIAGGNLVDPGSFMGVPAGFKTREDE